MCANSCTFAFMSACFHVYVPELQLRGLGNTVRMFRRLLRKILQLVCLHCLDTIKTQGRAIGTALFTCRGCDSREMKQSRSGEQMFPHATSPQRGTDSGSRGESDV